MPVLSRTLSCLLRQGLLLRTVCTDRVDLLVSKLHTKSDLQTSATMLGFFSFNAGAGDMNSGPHACVRALYKISLSCTLFVSV